jgi:hypothetical protein
VAYVYIEVILNSGVFNLDFILRNELRIPDIFLNGDILFVNPVLITGTVKHDAGENPGYKK